jgi:hypothetical protein
MPNFRDIDWLPLTAGLAVLGALVAWYAWRRRDAAAGLRALAWALVPLAAYLTGVLRLLWDFGMATSRWLVGLVFSPVVWAGVVLAGVSFVLFVVSGVLRRRRPRDTGRTRPAGRRGQPAVRGRAGSGGESGLDEFADIEELLRRRGIS